MRPGDEESDTLTSVGIGGTGSLMGGWVRGDKLGFSATGSDYAQYSIGNTYATGAIATLQNSGSVQTATYSVTSPDVDVYAHGTGRLVGGRAEVRFDADFVGMISADVPVTITVTPMGRAGQVWVSNVTKEGATIESDGGASVAFMWIAIGRRSGYEQRPTLPTVLADPTWNDKLLGVMFNENNLTSSAQSFWWDGSNYRFDAVPYHAEIKAAEPVPPSSNHSSHNPLDDRHIDTK